MPQNTYIRSPNDDYEPNNNIQLGHVWRDPRDPGSFIGPPVPIPGSIKINHNYKGSCRVNLGKQSGGKAGLWARIAHIPAAANTGTRWNDNEDGSYNIPVMDTYSMEPTQEYVEASIASVSTEILKSGINLYMITGIKIARGGEGGNSKSKTFNLEGSIGVNTTNASGLVETGEQFIYSRGTLQNQEFSSTGDFVFAYRLREIFYKKGVLKTKIYNKGAILGEGIPEGGGRLEDKEFVIKDVELGDDDVQVTGDAHLVEAGGESYVFII